MANLLDRIINYLADAVVKDSNGNATIEGDLTIGTDTVISDTQANQLSQTVRVTVPTGDGKSFLLKRDDDTEEIRMHLSSTGNKGLYDSVNGNWAIFFDSNNTLKLGSAPTIGSHNSPIGTQLQSGYQTGISIASGGSLKATGITLTIPVGVWIISYYGNFGANVANSTYRGIALRYRNVGESTWTTWTQSQITVGSWASASEVQPAISGCVVTEVESERVFELLARTSNAITFAGRVNAYRIA